MPFPLALQQAQQVPPDTTAAALTPVADTTVADATAADTLSAFTQLNREISEAGDLLLSGEWSLFFSKVYRDLVDLIAVSIPRIFAALIVFLLFYLFYRAVRSLLRRVLNKSKYIDAGLEHVVLQTFRVSALSFIVVMMLAQLGFNVGALLAGFGIAGIAVGFAARDTLENFISGVTILIDRPFRIGDNIVVEGTFGTVDAFTLRSTRLRTQNNEIMVMPNNLMINQKLINHTMVSPLRVEVPFGIAYKEYPQEARETILQLTEGDERLDPSHPPQVVVTSLNDSSVDMALRIFLKNPKIEVPIRMEYIEKVREALRRADIEIPFPHLQLFVDEAKAFENTTLMQPLLPASTAGSEPPQPSA